MSNQVEKVSVSLSKDVLDKLNAISKYTNIKRSTLINAILRPYTRSELLKMAELIALKRIKRR